MLCLSLGVLWLAVPLGVALALWWSSQRPGVGFIFFSAPQPVLFLAFKIAALLALWLGLGLMLLRWGRKK